MSSHCAFQSATLHVVALYWIASKEEVIMGSFLEQIVLTEDEPRPKKKKTTSTIKKTEKPKGCKDIRNFFQNAGRPRSNKDSTRTIVID